MVFPGFTTLGSFSLLILRLIIGIIFLYRGWKHLGKALSSRKLKDFSTFLPGFSEFIFAALIIAGLRIQIVAIILILVMLIGMYFKAFNRKVRLFNFNDNPAGWHYDVMILSANLVFLSLGAGSYAVG